MRMNRKQVQGLNTFRMFSGKKGIAGILFNAVGGVLAFAVLILVASFTALIVGNVRTTQTTNSIEYNVSTDGLTGLDNLSSLFGPQGLLIMAAVVIATLIGAFAVSRLRQ